MLAPGQPGRTITGAHQFLEQITAPTHAARLIGYILISAGMPPVTDRTRRNDVDRQLVRPRARIDAYAWSITGAILAKIDAAVYYTLARQPYDTVCEELVRAADSSRRGVSAVACNRTLPYDVSSDVIRAGDENLELGANNLPVFSLHDHFARVAQYRRKVMMGSVSERLVEIFSGIAQNHGITTRTVRMYGHLEARKRVQVRQQPGHQEETHADS